VDEPAPDAYQLVIPETVRQNMEDRYILLEDVQAVIKNAQESRKRFYNPINGDYLASLKIEHVTFWVQYAQENDKFLIKSVYSHRMEIVEE
jgi:hypothetical protein